MLVQIDPRDYQVAVERAKADLADAEAAAQASNLNVPVEDVNATTQVSSSEADVAGAQAGDCRRAEASWTRRSAQLQAAEANNARAQADLVRYRELVAKDEVSQQIYDQADATAKANAAAVEAARADVAAAEQQVKQAQGRVAQAAGGAAHIRTPGRSRWK